MSLTIKPQEVNYVETNNNVSVRTAVPKALLEDGKLLLSHVRRMALPADTEIRVSVMNDTHDVLLHTAMFMVWKAVVTRKRMPDDDGRGERVVSHTDYLIARVGEWIDSPDIEKPEVTEEMLATAQECTDPPSMNEPESTSKRGPGRPRKAEAA